MDHSDRICCTVDLNKATFPDYMNCYFSSTFSNSNLNYCTIYTSKNRSFLKENNNFQEEETLSKLNS